jgi:hypothetical protein
VSEPTLDQIIRGLYVTNMNLSGKCIYCGEDLAGDKPKYKERHFQELHTKTKKDVQKKKGVL